MAKSLKLESQIILNSNYKIRQRKISIADIIYKTYISVSQTAEKQIRKTCTCISTKYENVLST